MIDLMTVLDVTPISRPSSPRPSEPGPIGGDWAKSMWASSPAPAVSIVEPTFYEVAAEPPRWSLERGETGWTASDLVTGIFGFGLDPNAAIVDLVHALREHREVLERQDELSPDLEEQLAYLQRS